MSPDIRARYWKILQKYTNKQRNKGELIILIINENDNTSDEKGRKRLMLECGLVDIHNHHCDMDNKTRA